MGLKKKPLSERPKDKCPRCKRGELEARKNQYGDFWGCTRYPACKYLTKSRPFWKERFRDKEFRDKQILPGHFESNK